MNVIKQLVQHSRYGLGLITDQDPLRVIVKFNEPVGEKEFQYPEAFDAFLELRDEGVRAAVAGEIQALRDAAKAERDRRLQEEQDRREQEKQALLDAKKTAKKRAPAKKKTTK